MPIMCMHDQQLQNGSTPVVEQVEGNSEYRKPITYCRADGTYEITLGFQQAILVIINKNVFVRKTPIEKLRRKKLKLISEFQQNQVKKNLN